MCLGRTGRCIANDILVLQGDPTALQPIVDQAKLKMLGAEEIAELKPRDKDDLLESTEAVDRPGLVV